MIIAPRARQSSIIAFHIVVSDASDAVLDEVPELIADGYTSFKVYMTCEAMRLSDRKILDVMEPGIMTRP